MEKGNKEAAMTHEEKIKERFYKLIAEAEQRFLDSYKNDQLTGEEQNATALDYFTWATEEVIENYHEIHKE